MPLQSKTYRLKVDGTRPILQIELSSGPEAKEAPEKLTIELHNPVSGEIFEARTSVGRLEVDRNGRVMYFCQSGEKVGFTLFGGRSIVVTMTRSSGEVLVESPSKILSMTRKKGQPIRGLGNAPPSDGVMITLE